MDQVWDCSVQKGQRDSRKVLFWEAGVRADQTDTGWEQTKKYWDNNTETAYTGLGPRPDPGWEGRCSMPWKGAGRRAGQDKNGVDQH